MADKGVLIVVQHAIADPDRVWPELKALIIEALGKLGADHAQLALLSPQDLEIMMALGPNYLIRLRLTTLKQQMDEWMPAWLDRAFDLATKHHMQIDWFPERKPRPNVTQWLLEDSVALLMLRTSHNPELFGHLVREAGRRDIPVVRIDPESITASRVIIPTKEEGSDE